MILLQQAGAQEVLAKKVIWDRLVPAEESAPVIAVVYKGASRKI